MSASKTDRSKLLTNAWRRYTTGYYDAVRILSDVGEQIGVAGGQDSRNIPNNLIGYYWDLRECLKSGRELIRETFDVAGWDLSKLLTEAGPEGGVLQKPRVTIWVEETLRGNISLLWTPVLSENERGRYAPGDFKRAIGARSSFYADRPDNELIFLREFATIRQIAADYANREDVNTAIARNLMLATQAVTDDLMGQVQFICRAEISRRLCPSFQNGHPWISPETQERIAELVAEEAERDAEDEAQRCEAKLQDYRRTHGVEVEFMCRAIRHLRSTDKWPMEKIAEALNKLTTDRPFDAYNLNAHLRDGTRLLKLAREIDISKQPLTPEEIALFHSIMPDQAKRGAAARKPASRQPTAPEAEPYAGSRRYAGGADALEAVGLESVDALVQAINERRAEDGRKPIPQGSFPSNKANFDRVVAEFEAYGPSAPAPGR